MCGVVFLSSSAPERGERWGAGATVVGGQRDQQPACVYVCVCTYESQSIRCVCKVFHRGNNQGSVAFPLRPRRILLRSCFSISFSFASASILVTLLFHTQLTHAHSLRFPSLWAAE